MGIQQKGQTDYLPMSGQNKTQKSWAKKAHPTKVQPSSAKTRNKMVFASSLSQGKPNSRRYSLNFSMDKRLKECSTSTDVNLLLLMLSSLLSIDGFFTIRLEFFVRLNQFIMSIRSRVLCKKLREELENSENLKVTRKKQKKHNEKSEKKLEIKELRESYEEITKITKTIHEIILTRPDVPAISFKKETPTKKVEWIYECDFSTNDAQRFGKQTKFDTSAPWPETKGTLRKHCGSCGTVTRVYAPIECAIGAACFSLGLAEINHA